jgi:hypothetical protein
MSISFSNASRMASFDSGEIKFFRITTHRRLLRPVRPPVKAGLLRGLYLARRYVKTGKLPEMR